jgi:hypothetical protein
VDAIAWCARRKQILHGHFEHFRQVEERFVVNVGKPRFDLGPAAPADVEAGQLKLRREIGLRSAQRITSPPNLRTDVVFVTHGRSLSAVFCFCLRRLEADARRAIRLAKLD